LEEVVPYIEQSRKNLIVVICIYISIFINSIVFFKEPFEFYIGYIIYLFLLPGFINRFGFNRSLFFIFFILLVTGIFNVLAGNNTFALFFKVYLGLYMSYIFYNYVVQELNYNVEQLFKWYLKGAYLASLVGAIQFVSFQVGFTPGYDYGWLLNKWAVITGGNFGIRINSIFAEPTYFAAVLSSAFFVALFNLIRKEDYFLTKFQSIIIVGTYFLSFSGLGQMGIFLTFLFLAVSFGLVRYIIILIPLAIILFNVLYNNVGEFKSRYDSTVGLFSGEKFVLGKTHGSSYILYNNFVVATENFKTNFVFGTGIGSHPIAFEKYSIAKGIKQRGFAFNSADANSMLLRLISETGLFGVSIFLYIIFKFYVARNENDDSNYWLISNALLIMILLNLFRQGHYFLNGFPFFVILYYYNSVAHKKYLESPAPIEG
jgi:hypothetical protein